MKTAVCLVALVALAGAMTITDYDLNLGKDSLINKDIKMKEMAVMKLLNHVLQLTPYDDIREISRTYNIEDNVDKYFKVDIVKDFIKNYKLGMLPRGEIFTISNELQMREVIKCFHMLYFAKDFDTFIKTACWMRERINAGMFVYAMTVAVMHREDCRGITLPTPYEIYPYYFVNSDVINKAYMIKMKQGKLDNKLMNYYNMEVTDKNVAVINNDRDFRTVVNEHDRLNYFTEDIDLNTYYYYFHMQYPMWMGDDIYGTNKDRKGELYYYVHQQLLARYRLERLSHEMCDIKMLNWDLPLKTGYWPKIHYHTGYDMPTRMNDMHIQNEDNTHLIRLVDDYERKIRDAITKGYVTLRDGTRVELKKTEDIEVLGRLMQGNLDKDTVKFYRYLSILVKSMLGTSVYNTNKHMYIPTVIDQYETCLRDPLFWKLMKRFNDNFVTFKKLLPMYTREDLDFPGVKVDKIVTDKLVTYFDNYDVDMTNAVFMDEAEKKKQQSDFLFINRQLRLNNKNFKINIDVTSDKTTDCVVRIFIGPKYDCMGKLLKINDKRQDMVEIDAFVYQLKTGTNTITRDSHNMHNVLNDRTFTRTIWDKKFNKEVLNTDNYVEINTKDNYWYRSRLGFPKRLLLPKGHRGGLEMQLFVMVTPLNKGKLHTLVDMDKMKDEKVCRSTVCYDGLPLGFPFDRTIDVTKFYTNNMRFTDILIFHKDVEHMDTVKTHMNDNTNENDVHFMNRRTMTDSSEEDKY